ncbi:BON domain-containing protein [Solwaraspora sp. WMMB335]|uniref:BON domain-containing protein n=1 Tax=Solwaraspora sp. WMMB335 TaxID=3404118 RepID=UPI003B9443D4
MTAATVRRSDEEIQHDVLEELKWDARVQPNEIGVTVQQGVVTLLGWVDNYGKKWAAERTTHRVRGVVAVANDIEVRLPSSAERTDAEIAGAATRALEWDAFVPIERLEVTVAQGWVTLKGEVEWEFQRRAAERAVRRLSGVRGVTNLIAVRPRINPSATELRHDIVDALARSATTEAGRITVDSEGGRVVVKGVVQSWLQREEAERIAWSAPGVTAVENRITVEPGA